MRIGSRIDISVVQLETLMKALGSRGRGHFANDCNASINAAAFWFRDKKIPPLRLIYVAKKLHKLMESDSGMTSEQTQAKDFLEKTFGKKLAEIATEPVPPSHWDGIEEKKQARKQLGLGLERGEGLSLALSRYETEALVDALSIKGWIVNISRKESL